MNTILIPSFSDWLFDLINSWINMFDKTDDDEDRGDAHEEDDKDAEDAAGNKNKKDDDEDPEKDKKDDPKKVIESKNKNKDDDGEDGDDDDDPKKDHMIPKHRYDSAATRAKNAEDRNDELETENASLRAASKKDPDAPDLDTQLSDIDRKIEEARADNKIDEVVALGKEQRVLEREYNQEVATTASTAAGKEAREQIQLDGVIDELEENHTVIQEDHEDYDQTVISEILDIQRGLVLGGKYTPAQAMRKAAKLILPGKVAGEKPDPKVTDIKKNLKTAEQIPPDTKEKGEDSDKAGDIEDASAISEMTMEEFDAIPESTLKRLRGDAI